MNPIIQTRHITKSFGKLQVLKGIDLEIYPGEILSVVGSSGAGKTTLLQIIGTLDSPDSGEILLDGKDILRLSEREKAMYRNLKIGFVFQFHHLLPEFTACENVMLPAMIAGKSERKAKVESMEIITRLGMKDRADHRPNELSGGEKQRIAVARALINRPELILADEPSGSLDSQNKDELHDLFFDLRNRFGQTFMIVTHDTELAKRTDRIVSMKDGCIVS